LDYYLDPESYLTPEERAHYQRFLGQGQIIMFVHPDRDQPWRWTATSVDLDDPAPDQLGRLREIEAIKTRDGLLIPHGGGPDTCSSSQVLALTPEICWDACGYYRRLGLHWKATRKQIRDALAKSRALIGSGDAHLTYAASQLLNQEIRREYDRLPLGKMFLKDKDVVARLKKAAQDAASAMAARGFPDMTPEDVLGNWGFSVGQPGGPGGEGEESPAPAAPLPSPARAFSARWSAQWTWYSDPDLRFVMTADAVGGVPLYRLRELEHWQHALVSEFARRGMKARFAVGLCTAETFVIRRAPDPGIIVILLGEGEPTPELAADAVDMWGLTKEPQSQGDMYAKLLKGRRAG
jgi:hypothetical protein